MPSDQPVGLCRSTTQLLVVLVACPPGPDPLTNCSSRSSSASTGTCEKSKRFLLTSAALPVLSCLTRDLYPATSPERIILLARSSGTPTLSAKKKHIYLNEHGSHFYLSMIPLTFRHRIFWHSTLPVRSCNILVVSDRLTKFSNELFSTSFTSRHV